jgi:hypothetical protein
MIVSKHLSNPTVTMSPIQHHIAHNAYSQTTQAAPSSIRGKELGILYVLEDKLYLSVNGTDIFIGRLSDMDELLKDFSVLLTKYLLGGRK